MKYILAISLYLLFSLGSVYLYAQGNPAEVIPVYARVLSDKVNIRAGGGLNFEILGKLQEKDTVVVTGERFNWYKIRLPPQARCFVHRDYVEQGRVKANRLRVRAGAGVNFNVLGILKRGETVEILAEEGEWLRIVPPQICAGWVKKEYLQLTQRKFIPEPQRVSILPPPREAEEQLNRIKICGVIDELGKIINRPGTHKLIKGKRILYYLRSKKINLNHYVYQKVSISGRAVHITSPYPVLEVEHLEVLP